MAWTFRRQIKLGPINLNFSRSGLGASAGTGPFRAGVDAKGRQYTNMRGPFGLYNRQYRSAATQTAHNQSVGSPNDAVVRDSILALLFSTVAVIVLSGGTVEPQNQKWFLLFILLTGVPAILGFVGYFGHKDPTNGWFKAVAGVLSTEKWLLVGVLIVAFVALINAGGGGRKRR